MSWTQIWNAIETSPFFSQRVIGSVVTVVVLWLIRLLAIRVVKRNVEELGSQYKWRKNLTYVTVFIGVLVISRIWFEGLQTIATFFGLLSAGIAVALREPISDMAGWVFIMWRRPFEVGDRIEVGNLKGDVVDTRVFKFTVLEIGNTISADQSTGRVIHVPNHKVFSDSLANYTSDFAFVWNEIPILLTFESDWKKAKDLLGDIAEEHLQEFVSEAEKQLERATDSYLIRYQHLTPIVYTDVKESGINLTLRHLCNPRRKRSINESIWEDVLAMVEEHDDIDLAYPTVRVYRDDIE